MNHNLTHLPERPAKPRESGLTMVMDKGLSLRQAEDFLEVNADKVDLLKLGFGTSIATPNVKEKINLYHDAGLPPQFQSLISLEKMRLSYNVFEGELDSEAPVLGSLTKLTHLELESNYFTGDMPASIKNMDKLTYLYMRRNNMQFNLDFLKDAKFTDELCKLPFDDGENRQIFNFFLFLTEFFRLQFFFFLFLSRLVVGR